MSKPKFLSQSNRHVQESGVASGQLYGRRRRAEVISVGGVFLQADVTCCFRIRV